ncbi:MAG: RHS repeat domain-containing protein [Mangrovibacterium sp.]
MNDANGKQIYINTSDSVQTQAKERTMLWDEENRLRAICDNGYVSSYFYDAAGERTVKLHGASEGIHVNSAFSGGFTNNQNYTLYVNPYLVLQQGGQYTKHIYIGSQRIVSKLGDVGSFGVDPRREEYAGASVSGTSVPDYANKYKALQEVIKQNYAGFEIDYYGANNDDYVNGAGFCCGESMQSKSIPTAGDAYEKLQYYYHPDHLGSASYITNLDGEVVQHIEYVPFGEVFIEERNNTWNTPYLFNGKEFDSETGLYYYGARYYNPRISLWHGVDPLTEEYPSWSPYHYCHNNPISLIDPTGMAATKYEDEEGNLLLNTNDGSEDVVTVSNDKVEDFRYYAETYEDQGMKDFYDSKSWNDNMKADILDFETIDDMEGFLSNTSSQWARQKLIDFRQESTTENWIKFLGAEVLSQNANPLNHMPSPIKVKATPKISIKSNLNTAPVAKSNPWQLFNKEMGRGKFTKAKYGTSEAAAKARKKAYEQWKSKNGYK